MGLTTAVNMRDEVDNKLRHYIDSIKIRSKANLNDGAVDAEGFFRNFLNLLYKFKLSKDNIESAYNTAIDLHWIEGKVCVQITAQNTKSKIDHTVKHFIKNKRYELYTQLYILILDRGIKFTYDCSKISSYGVNIILLDYTEIFKKIVRDFDSVESMEQVYVFVRNNLDNEYLNEIKNQPQKDNSSNQELIELKDQHIVDQIYTVLSKFNEFSCIYPYTIAKLYPFNIEKQWFDPYSNYTLRTNNKAIYEVLQNIKINELYEIEIQNEELIPFTDKLKEIFIKLNNSLIVCICYREKYTEIENFNIKIKENRTDCDCFQCQYHKFKIPPFFGLLNEKAITHSSDLQNALSESYYLCKLGEHIKGWQVLHSVAGKSFEKKLLITYFITQFNSLAIYNFVRSPSWENQAKAILPIIDKIDLHSLISALDIPLIVRDELINIKENYYLYVSRERIDEYYDRIIQTKVLYENNGFGGGANTHIALFQEMYLLFIFYTSNHIIVDDFSAFRKTITKGIEALFISYTTDDRCDSKYTKFDHFTILLILFYVDEDAIKRIFKTYRVNNIELVDIDKPKFLDMAVNFFSFQIVHGPWNKLETLKDINNQSYFSRYRQLLRNAFNRFMLLLSKINLTYEELAPLKKPFIDYLKGFVDVNHSSWDYALKFFKRYLQVFDDKQIQEIIELMLSIKHHRNGDGSFNEFCELAAVRASFIIKDAAFFKTIFDKLSLPCVECGHIHDRKHLLGLWKISKKAGKIAIKSKLVEFLNNKFDPDLYGYAVFTGVFNKKEQTQFLNQYISHIQNVSHENDLQLEKGHWIMHSFSAFNCINCLLFMNFDFNDQRLQTIAQKSDYYNWLINHSHYDYSSFNVRWLIDACPYHLKRKLSINKGLKERIEKELSRVYDLELNKLYFECFITNII